ncbi:hypothetical protein N566_25025 [Streptomycetaceae bacterium MP113-05]|nr:hypothetical protein N566_25025 [Streptomycetaceae bacterium MP113-05]
MAGHPEASAEQSAMRRAVALAARGLGSTSPNPVVGCVVLARDGSTVGEGWHQRAGGPHAEVHALAEAGDDAVGGTAVVTLEPCDHTGRTGPCSSALVDAGISRVVYAVPDPTGAAAGGAARLSAAGVDVSCGLLAEEAVEVNAAWLTSVRRSTPYVTWKYAATLDGRSAAADGTSRWITSAASRADVHRLRAESDAVLVGSGTLRADDPHLAVRGVDGAVQPLRVVLDTEAVLGSGARILDGAAPTLVAVASDAATGHLPDGTDVLRLPRSDDGRGLALHPLLTALYARGVRSALLEGGPTLAGAFVAADAVDRVVGYLAPVLLGDGPPALAGAGITTLTQALRLHVTGTVRLGPDVRVTAVPGGTAPPPVPGAGATSRPAAQDRRN